MKRHYFFLGIVIIFMVILMAHQHMILKKGNSKKRRFSIKVLFYLVIIYFGFSYTFYYSLKNSKKISNEDFINLLVKTGNANMFTQYHIPNLVNSTMKFIFDIDFRKPVTVFNSSILKYGSSNKKINKNKTIQLEYNDDYSDMDDLKNISSYINDPNPKEVKQPVIYLYNSHQLENYSNENLDVYGITPNVMMASYVFREKLSELGIDSIVEEENLSELLSKNGWNYSYSYQASRILLEKKKKDYPGLKYFIDIHRDSVGKSASTIKIGDVNYAKVLFVIGLDYSGWEANYQFAEKINQMINVSYSGLSRGIMKKSGMNVNGVYNQDFSPNCILIEVGGVENTIEEVYQTINVLAQVLSKYIKGDY